MSLTLPNRHKTSSKEKESLLNHYGTLLSWFLSWEMYLVVIVAAFLRLYRINTTEFDDDQAAIFHMAYNAVTHGLLVATANEASVHIYNPPATIYLYMLPAAISNDPMWGAVWTGVLMTFSVLLTYIFTRRYSGRLAGTIAALMYATAFLPVYYSRFMWNQNLLPLFTILFFIALFWGVVERRKGWLFPALLLLGLLIQLHATGVFMAVPLLAALVLAPGTIRWRDLALGVLSLFIIYLPYLLWEVSTHFVDVHILLATTHQKVLIDNKAWLYYQSFLSPYDVPPAPYTVVSHLVPFLSWLGITMTLLVLASAATILVLAAWPWQQFSPEQKISPATGWRCVVYSWTLLRNSPYRCGLLLLLTWQIVPLLLLSRHSVELHQHYLIIFMPGPFILIALFTAKVAKWLQHHSTMGTLMQIMRYSVYALAVLIIAAQLVGSTAKVLDYARGNYSDGAPVHNLYNDLRSLQAALSEADQVAQQHHLNRVYISTDWPTQASLRYLSGQMQTPTTLFTDLHCAVLPGANEGPAVMLVGPYSEFTNALVTHFATATLIDEPKRPGGAPFRLYIVTSPTQQSVPNGIFGHNLQLLNAPAQPLLVNGTSWLVTRWSFLRSAQPSYRTLYGYHIALLKSADEQSIAGESINNQCAFTATRAGDQLLAAFNQPKPGKETHTSATITIRVQSYSITPLSLPYGPLSFATYFNITIPWKTLYTSDGKDTIVVPISRS